MCRVAKVGIKFPILELCTKAAIKELKACCQTLASGQVKTMKMMWDGEVEKSLL